MPPARVRPHGPFAWLWRLTLVQLQRVAFLTGTPASGTKATVIANLEQGLGPLGSLRASRTAKSTTRAVSGEELSIVSVDMGIRNLAYAHLVTKPALAHQTRGEGSGEGRVRYARPHLRCWERVAISVDPKSAIEPSKRTREKPAPADDGVTGTAKPGSKNDVNEQTGPTPGKESFDPSVFAEYAYSFITDILHRHRPTHILIERQRFRSGGGSAVQEWTIRVGVFEGMLYAVLKTLAEVQGDRVTVHGMDPGRVSRYWLEGRVDKTGKRVGTGTEGKKSKIDLVGKSLESPSQGLVEIPTGTDGQGVNAVVDAFLTKWKGNGRRGPGVVVGGLRKLDDLADCMLQGVAWIDWQNKRREIVQQKWNAIAHDPVFTLKGDEISDLESGEASRDGKSKKELNLGPKRSQR